MAGLSQKDQRTVLSSMEAQGAKLRKTAKGTVILFPSGGTEMMHTSPSDIRGIKNLRATIRRNGFQWPFDGQQPKKATEGATMPNLTQSERETVLSGLEAQGAILEARGTKTLIRLHSGKKGVLHADGGGAWRLRQDILIDGMSWPLDSQNEQKLYTMEDLAKVATPLNKPKKNLVEPPALTKKRQPTSEEVDSMMQSALAVRARSTVNDIVAETGLSVPTVIKRLRKFGWEQDGVRGSGIWVNQHTVKIAETPAAPVIEAIEESKERIAQGERAVTTMEAERPAVREFIDTCDSWTADLTGVGQMSVNELLTAYHAAGLQFEIRLWKD